MRDERTFVSVSQLNSAIKQALEGNEAFSSIFLRGEISNFKVYSSGHAYFSLKDDKSTISAVMWASSAMRLTFTPKDGDEVLAHGRISVYPPRGSYQISIDYLELFGKGAELLRLQQLKEKLAREGLFDMARKRPIAPFPKRIGVIAGASSAGLRDIVVNIEKRWPLVELLVFPSLVQGIDAPKDLVRAMRLAAGMNLDTLIIGRGGGSSEDLGAFNDEAVVRHASSFPCPVIAAVGHEVDVTLIDLVADLRVSTPTGAAVASTPDGQEIAQSLDDVSMHLDYLMKSRIDSLERTLNLLSQRSYFQNPGAIYDKKLEELTQCERRLDLAIETSMGKNGHAVETLQARLAALNPYAVLNRGYAISEDGKGNVLTSVSQLGVGETMITRLRDGIITSTVETKESPEDGK